MAVRGPITLADRPGRRRASFQAQGSPRQHPRRPSPSRSYSPRYSPSPVQPREVRPEQPLLLKRQRELETGLQQLAWQAPAGPAPALRAGCGLPGAERAAAPGPAGKTTTFVEPLLLGRFCAVQHSAAHAAEGDSRGRLPHSAKATDEDATCSDVPGARRTRFVKDTWLETRGRR